MSTAADRAAVLTRLGPAGDRPTGLAFAVRMLVGLAAWISGGCNVLDDTQELPRYAEVDIIGSAPDGGLVLVISDDFVLVDDLVEGTGHAELIRADTALVDVGFTNSYSIVGRHRFLVRLSNPGADTADITLTVSFDGVVSYRRSATLADGGALEFSQVFRGT